MCLPCLFDYLFSLSFCPSISTLSASKQANRSSSSTSQSNTDTSSMSSATNDTSFASPQITDAPSVSPAPTDINLTSPKTTDTDVDTDTDLKDIWVLIHKKSPLPSLRPILPAYLLHWALKVGDDVFDLVTIDIFGQIEYRHHTWEKVKKSYEKKEYRGTTYDTTETLTKEAERVTEKFKSENLGYNFVVSNCQQFVRQLESRIVKKSLSLPFRRPEPWEDISRYLKDPRAGVPSGTKSLQEALDKLFKWIMYLWYMAIGAGLTYLEKILTGIQNLLAYIWTMFGEAFGRLFNGLQATVQFLEQLLSKTPTSTMTECVGTACAGGSALADACGVQRAFELISLASSTLLPVWLVLRENLRRSKGYRAEQQELQILRGKPEPFLAKLRRHFIIDRLTIATLIAYMCFCSFLSFLYWLYGPIWNGSAWHLLAMLASSAPPILMAALLNNLEERTPLDQHHRQRWLIPEDSSSSRENNRQERNQTEPPAA